MDLRGRKLSDMILLSTAFRSLFYTVTQHYWSHDEHAVVKLKQPPDRTVTLQHNLGHNQEFFVKIVHHLKKKLKRLQGESPHD